MRAAVTDAEVLNADVRFCLVLPREMVSVPVMRRVIGGTLLGFGADAESVADLMLAATEACTNVLRHGERAEEYQVYASVGKDACLLEIANGLAVAASQPERREDGQPGGRPTGHGGDQLTGREDEQPNGHGGQTAARPAAPSAGDMSAAGPDIARIPESGRGLTIMRACVDDLTLRDSAEHGTVVSIRKRITWADAAPGYGVPTANGHAAAGPDDANGNGSAGPDDASPPAPAGPDDANGRRDPAALREAS